MTLHYPTSRYILTGAPGSGKTSIIRALAESGHCVVEEAATDVIAIEQARGSDQPWTHPKFIEDIARLQMERMSQASGPLQFHDRSLICTLALARHLGYPPPKTLSEEISRCVTSATFRREVFLVESLGFIEPTAARRITLKEAKRFETIHEETYRELGFEITRVPTGILRDRVAMVRRQIIDQGSMTLEFGERMTIRFRE